MKHKWIIIVVGLSLASTVIAYKQWQRLHAPQARGGLPVMTHQVTSSLFQESVQTIGFLKALSQAEVKTEVAGNIIRVEPFEGQVLQSGAPLLAVDNLKLKQALKSVAGTLELAKLNFERNRVLIKSKVISAAAFDESAAKLKEVQALYNQAVIDLEKSVVRTPFSGVGGLRRVNVGDYLHIGDVVATMTSLDPMTVEFSLAQKYLPKIKAGLKLHATTEAWPGTVYEGVVEAVDPQLDPITGMVVAKATIRNEDLKLRPGLFATIELLLEEDNAALMIPEEAIIPAQNAWMVMKVVDGRIKTESVQISARTNGQVKIEKGLMVGDEIVTAGQMKVRDGMPVTPIPMVPPRPAQS